MNAQREGRDVKKHSILLQKSAVVVMSDHTVERYSDMTDRARNSAPSSGGQEWCSVTALDCHHFLQVRRVYGVQACTLGLPFLPSSHACAKSNAPMVCGFSAAAVYSNPLGWVLQKKLKRQHLTQ